MPKLTEQDIIFLRSLPKFLTELRNHIATLRLQKGEKGDSIMGPKGKDGIRGRDGKTPIKGIDYFTKQEVNEFLNKVTPIKGQDYFDGETPDTNKIVQRVLEILNNNLDILKGEKGEDAVLPDIEQMINERMKLIKDGKDGVDGKDAVLPDIDFMVKKQVKDATKDLKAEDGHTPTKEELLAIIEPLIQLQTLGTKEIDESNIGHNKVLTYDKPSDKLVYKRVETGTGGGGGSVTTPVPIRTETSAYSVASNDYVILCDASSSAFTVSLPAAAAKKGKIYQIKKIDSSANKVTLDPDGAETIDGCTTIDITMQYDSLMVVSDNANWHII